MELGPQNHSRDGLLAPSSITVVYMDPLRAYLYPPGFQIPQVDLDLTTRKSSKSYGALILLGGSGDVVSSWFIEL